MIIKFKLGKVVICHLKGKFVLSARTFDAKIFANRLRNFGSFFVKIVQLLIMNRGGGNSLRFMSSHLHTLVDSVPCPDACGADQASTAMHP